MKRATSLSVLSATVLLASAANATPPATLDQLHETLGEPAHPPDYVILDLTVAQATAQIKKIAAWDVTMQATACADPDAGLDASSTACEVGGIIEVESGPGMAIVASDNTQEAIGLWSDNQKLNGVAYPSNIAKAFTYLGTHPGYLAWKVAGDPGPADYYSVYNCGWGVRAVILYEAMTGDTSHHDYGVLCADHIAMYASALVNDEGPLIDTGAVAWGASGLWAWGDANGDAAAKTTAAGIGGQVKAWIETAPSLRLPSQEWAVTGAAAFYGVVESYMKENPTELTAWVTKYAPMLGGWIDESTPEDPNDWTDWRNAFNSWNMLAQFTSAEVLGPKTGNANEAVAKDILTKLVAQAGSTSGAIPGSQQRPSTEAESWITAYMVYFGLLQIIDAPEVVDAGAEAGAKDAAAPRDAGAPMDAAGDAAGDAATAGDGGGGCAFAGASAGGARDGLPLGALVGLVVVAVRRRRSACRTRFV